MAQSIQDLIAGGFGGEFKEAPKPEPVEVIKETKPKRSVDDVYVAMEAQRIFDPNMPTVNKPKAPKNAMVDTGTSSALGVEGDKEYGW